MKTIDLPSFSKLNPTLMTECKMIVEGSSEETDFLAFSLLATSFALRFFNKEFGREASKEKDGKKIKRMTTYIMAQTIREVQTQQHPHFKPTKH